MAAARNGELAGLSRVEHAEATLARALLTGELPPGGRLVLPRLSETYGIGTTPLREALSRLAAHGLVVLNGNRGFCASKLSREDLADITESRILIESAALSRAMVQVDDQWEDELVAATHRLLLIVHKSDSPQLEGTPEYDEAHKRFHAALVAGCGLSYLTDIQARLYDAAYRYRRIMHDARLSRDFISESHQRLADLVLSRDLPRAIEELERHLRTTLKVVYDDD